MPMISWSRFRRADAWPASLALALMAVAILWGGRALFQTGDSLDYARAAHTGQGLFHPHHLLFSPIIRVFHLALSASGITQDPIVAGQIHNLLWAVVLLIALHRLLLRSTESRSLATAAGLFYGSSFGFLAFSTQVETYIPATACALLTIWSLEAGWAGPLSSLRSWGPIAALALGILYHQTGVLLCLPLAVYFWLQKGDSWQRRYLELIGVSAAAVLCVYLAAWAGRANSAGIEGFFHFCLRYGVGSNPEWGTLSNTSWAGLRELLESQLENLILVSDERLTLGCWILGAVIVLLLGWNLRAGARRLVPLRVFFCTWLLTCYLFFWWWLPSEHEFFVSTSLPLVVLAMLLLTDCLGSSRRAALGVSVLMAGIALGGLLPHHWNTRLRSWHESRGPSYATAQDLRDSIPADCVFFGNRRVIQNLEFYFDVPKKNTVTLPRTISIFYEEGAPPKTTRLNATGCRVIPRKWILPSTPAGPSAARKGFTAHAQPERWWAYLSWALRIEADSETGSLTLPQIQTLRGATGAVYLLQDGPLIEFDGMGALAQRLDELEPRKRNSRGEFTRWYATAGKKLEGGPR